ncbi:MAG TPA: sugar transferase, partial [Pyrinomonadaceae bacterium]|nr:sugar transferase [Pyrinomonadaceae bacterium]
LPAILFLSPLMAVIAVIIRAGSRGPVVFKQERVGMDGRVFLCYKFRTMYADVDDGMHRDAYRRNINGNNEPNCDEPEQVFGKVPDDPRITPAGRWLRRTSLDELPQLFNVIKGDMSIVGPRPPIPYEVEEYQLRHRKRLDMKPGITGLWQVSGRSRLSFEEMVRIDLYYIENWSLWLDLRIIVLTLPAVFRGDGAH